MLIESLLLYIQSTQLHGHLLYVTDSRTVSSEGILGGGLHMTVHNTGSLGEVSPVAFHICYADKPITTAENPRLFKNKNWLLHLFCNSTMRENTAF